MNKIEATGRIDNIAYELSELDKQASKMGFDAELHDMFDDTVTLYETANKLMNDCKDKQFELSLVETLAWDSNEPSIVDLRQQLMLATKLIYAEDIAETIKINKNQNSDDSYDGGQRDAYVGLQLKLDEQNDDVITYKTPYDIYYDVKNYLHKRKKYRTILKKSKQEIKKYVGLK